MNLDADWVAVKKIVYTMILGGLIGFERGMASKPTGLRTHMLVGTPRIFFDAWYLRAPVFYDQRIARRCFSR